MPTQQHDHPVLDEIGPRTWGVWDLARSGFVKFTADGWRDGITESRARWWVSAYSTPRDPYEARELDPGALAAGDTVKKWPRNPYRGSAEELEHLCTGGLRLLTDAERAKEESQMNQRRANRLADECQTLRDANTDLLAENARLRRRKATD